MRTPSFRRSSKRRTAPRALSGAQSRIMCRSMRGCGLAPRRSCRIPRRGQCAFVVRLPAGCEVRPASMSFQRARSRESTVRHWRYIDKKSPFDNYSVPTTGGTHSVRRARWRGEVDRAADRWCARRWLHRTPLPPPTSTILLRSRIVAPPRRRVLAARRPSGRERRSSSDAGPGDRRRSAHGPARRRPPVDGRLQRGSGRPVTTDRARSQHIAGNLEPRRAERPYRSEGEPSVVLLCGTPSIPFR